MAIFKKNKKAKCPNCDKTFDTEQERNEHFNKEHNMKQEEIQANAQKTETTNQEEVTLEQAIALNTEAWYKAKVLEQLITINENLAMLIEVANAEPDKETHK